MNKVKNKNDIHLNQFHLALAFEYLPRGTCSLGHGHTETSVPLLKDFYYITVEDKQNLWSPFLFLCEVWNFHHRQNGMVHLNPRKKVDERDKKLSGCYHFMSHFSLLCFSILNCSFVLSSSLLSPSSRFFVWNYSISSSYRFLAMEDCLVDWALRITGSSPIIGRVSYTYSRRRVVWIFPILHRFGSSTNMFWFGAWCSMASDSLVQRLEKTKILLQYFFR